MESIFGGAPPCTPEKRSRCPVADLELTPLASEVFGAGPPCVLAQAGSMFDAAPFVPALSQAAPISEDDILSAAAIADGIHALCSTSKARVRRRCDPARAPVCAGNAEVLAHVRKQNLKLARARRIELRMNKPDDGEVKYRRLAKGFNKFVLRSGEKAQPGLKELRRRDGRLRGVRDATLGPAEHANTINPEGVLRVGFDPHPRKRQGVDGTSHIMEFQCAIAAVCDRLMRRAVSQKLQDNTSEALVIWRHFDPTPQKVRFGTLQEDLFPHARYLIRVEDKWKAVTLAQFRKVRPKARLQFGIVEVMAARFDLCVASLGGELDKCQLLLPPCVLQSTRAGVVIACLNSILPELSVEALLKRTTFTIVHDAPDAATGMTRCKAYFSEVFAKRSLLWYVPAVCSAHQLHRTMVSTAEDSVVAGDVYSVAFVASIPSHQATLQSHLFTIINDELVIKHSEPDPVWAQHGKEWCKHTLKRFVSETRGSLGPDDIFDHKATEVAAEVVEAVFVWANGDPRIDTVSHHWTEQSGSRAHIVENMYSAFLNAGLMLSDSKLNSMNRWGSTSLVMSVQVGASFFFDILRRVFNSAFPNWNAGMAPAGPGNNNPDISDDWRKYVRSKVWRAKCVLADQHSFPRHAVLVFVAVPIDYLWSRLQWLDQRGKVLFDIVGGRNPITDCVETLVQHVERASTWFSPLLWRYPDAQEELSREIRLRTLCTVCQLWWRFMHLEEFPYIFVRMVLPNATPESIRKLAELFFGKRKCCLEPDMALKVSAFFGTAAKLVASERFRRVVYAWADGTKLCNMHIERLLALIRLSLRAGVMAGTPDIEKVIACGLLSQWRSSYNTYGGLPLGVITREELVAADVPLARVAPKEGSGHTSGFVEFTNREKARRRTSTGALKGVGFAQELRSHAQQWASMSEAEKTPFQQQARSRHLRQQAGSNVPEVPDAVDRTLDCNLGLGSRHSPLALHHLETEIRRELGLSASGRLPGAMSWCRIFRQAARQQIFIRDQGH